MKKSIVTIFLLAMLGGLWYAAHSWSGSLMLKDISIRGNTHVAKDEIRNLIVLPDSIRLKDIDLAQVRDRVLRHPYVKDASVNREFPSRIRVTIDERKPAAILVGSRMAIVDEEGIVLPVKHGESLRDLAVISGSFTIPQTGDAVAQDAVVSAIRIVMATRRSGDILYHLFSEIFIEDDGFLVLYTTDGGVPVYAGKTISAQKLIAFREFWIQEVIPAGAQRLLSVDMRYEGQIITRWKT